MMTIWMDSVNLTMTKVGLPAFIVYRCNELQTYGSTVWWDTPGFSQATVTEVRTIGGQDFHVELHLDDGYDPSPLLNSSTGEVHSVYTNPKTGRLEAGPFWSTVSGATKPVEGHSNTYTVRHLNSYFTLQVGYKLLACGSFIFCNKIEHSNNTVMNDYSLLNYAGFGWFSTGNRKTTFSSFSLELASFPPPNGTELPAVSSSADGIYSADDYIGPAFDSCFFAALDDDCMAVHGSLSPITGPGSTINSFTIPHGDAAVGETLRFYPNTTFEPLGTAIVTSTSQNLITVDHLPLSPSELATTFWSNPNRIGSLTQLVTVVAAPLSKLPMVLSPAIFSKASLTARSPLGPSSSTGKRRIIYSHHYEQHYQRWQLLSKATAAVMIHGDGGNPKNGNSNITIDGLVIDGASASNLYIGASEGVELGDVTFLNAFKGNYTIWESWPGSVATFENVSFSGVRGERKVVGGVGKAIDLLKIVGKVEGEQWR